MFKGIIEEVGVVQKSTTQAGGKTFFIASSLARKAEMGNSISVNGVCTTVVAKESGQFSFYASPETLALTNLSDLKEGDKVNLEKALVIGETMDGHFVTGHVDKKIKAIQVEKKPASVIFSFAVEKSDLVYLIPKGSVAINGISLTVYRIEKDSEKSSFQVMIIPYTYENTNLNLLKTGGWVNVEFDSLGKYLKNFYDHSRENQS